MGRDALTTSRSSDGCLVCACHTFLPLGLPPHTDCPPYTHHPFTPHCPPSTPAPALPPLPPPCPHLHHTCHSWEDIPACLRDEGRGGQNLRLSGQVLLVTTLLHTPHTCASWKVLIQWRMAWFCCGTVLPSGGRTPIPGPARRPAWQHCSSVNPPAMPAHLLQTLTLGHSEA